MSRFAALASCTVVLAALGLGPAQAAPIFFATPSGPLGTSQAYGPITASGFTVPTSGAQTGHTKGARHVLWRTLTVG